MHATHLCTAAVFGALGFLLPSAAAQTLPSNWVAHFDGPAHYDDFATSGVVLPSGTVVTAGTTWWEPQPGLFVPKFFTAAYSPQGVELWSQLYGSGFYGGNGAADHVAIAPGNKLVVAGQRDLGAEWVAVQYDQSGAFQWESIWAAGSWFVSSPADIAIDSAGNTYLCGDIGDSISGSIRAAVVKIGPTGTLVWSRLYDGLGLAIESVNTIAVDSLGAVFVAGGTSAANGAFQFSVSRLDPVDGASLWIRHHGSTSPGAFNYGREIGIDGADRMIAGGEVTNDATQTIEMSFVSYASNGSLAWRVEHAAAANSTEVLEDLAVSASGEAAAAGWVIDPTGDVDWLVMRVLAGQVAWSQTFAGSAGLEDRATSVAIDAQGSILASGFATDPDLSLDLRVYSPSGALVFQGRELAPAQGTGYARDLALSPSGDAYVIGDLGPFDVTGGDAVTVAFDLATTGSYCSAKTTSNGCIPAISSTGSPSASATSGFVVRSVNMRNSKVGALIYTNGGRSNVPFAGGTLCVGGAPRRVQGLDSGGSPLPASDCSGVYSVDMNAFRAGTLGGNPAAFLFVIGTVVDCQFWGRDPGFAPPNNVQLSDALEFMIGV